MVFGRAETPLATCGPFTDFSIPDWDAIDAEFSAILSPVHQRLASDETSTATADIFSSLFRVHLERYEVIPTSGTSPSTSKVTHHRKNSPETKRVEKFLS